MTHDRREVNRRDFLGATGAVAAGSLIGAGRANAAPVNKMRVALVGTGSRGTGMWGAGLSEYMDVVEYVAVCDINPVRVETGKRRIEARLKDAAPNINLKTYTDFDRMIRENDIDTVIVTTMDSFHAQYDVRAMELGCNVISEKPMATTAEQVQQILDAEKRTGKKMTVTFNYRYGPDATAAKEILASGEIGEVTSLDFHWWLNTSHGADYFRRWHAYRKNGGSLWVHKASHHFDLINWWLDADPVEVFAKGELRNYGKNGSFRSTHCRVCPHTEQCDYYMDLTRRQSSMDLYAGAAQEFDGYTRDGCVYREDIDIWDTMAATVSYNNGVMLSYSLNAFMPYEGMIVGFNCTKGRLDMTVFHRQPWEEPRLAEIRVTQNFKETRVRDIFAGGSGHGGADTPLKDSIFRPGSENYLGRSAGSRAGAYSAMTGIAAYTSIDQKRPIKIADLVTI